MLTFNLIWIFMIIFIIKNVTADSESKGRGFGEQYNWYGFDEGLEVAREKNMPLMLIIHKSWCAACKALKPQIAASKELEAMSKNFIMVNVENGEESQCADCSPDGGYIPRIFFLDSNGKVLTDFFNEEGNPSYKYFYRDADSVVSTMGRVKDFLKSDVRTTDEL